MIGVDGEQNLCVLLMRSRSAFLLHSGSTLLLCSKLVVLGKEVCVVVVVVLVMLMVVVLGFSLWLGWL